jgi:dihydrodiol dehydrogenase / D-xylose 1-dehydrogenase (NADP)
VNALKSVPHAEVVACAARSIKSAQEFSKKHGIPAAYGNYEDLVNDKNVQVVYVSSLHHCHYEHTMLALNHGKHVLVEKPAAIDTKQLSAMYKLAEEKNLFLMEGLWTVFFPAFQKAQELIANGTIGEVNYVQTDFGINFPKHIDRIWKPELAGGALLDIGVYSIGVSTLLMNGCKEPPLEVKANGVIENGVDVVGAVILKFSDSKIAVSNWNAKAHCPGESLICGSKGFIKIMGSFHHPSTLSVTLKLEGGHTETTQYNFPFPSEKKVDDGWNFSGSIGFVYEATAVQNDILAKKKMSSVYPPKSSLIINGILEEVRKQIGLVYPFEKSNL